MAFTVRAWRAWSEGAAVADGPAAPLLLRRRVTPLGQHALRLAWTMPCSGEARVITSSRHGEFSRWLAIADGLAAGEGVSPAEFSLSVHHALVGLLSIARANRRGHTAVSAGPESFCFGLLEALACLSESPREPVLLIHYDAPLPEPFTRFAPETGAPQALALELAADGPGEAMTLAMTPTAPPGPDDLPNPAAGFCAFLANPDAACLTIAGPRTTWTWTRDARPA